MQSCDDHESALCPALRSVPVRVRKGHDSHRSAILNAGVIFNRFAERSLLSALIGSSPARSSPRVLAPRVARYPPAPGSSPALFLHDGNSWAITRDFVVVWVNAEKAGSEKLGMTLKGAVTRLGRFSHPEMLILR